MVNVVLLTIDTLRRDVLGCYNGSNLTPFIDTLQKKSIKFTNAYSTGPYTQASFPAILTSTLYLEYGRQKGLSKKRTLISEVLQKEGITTAAFHSNPYLSGFFGWNRGWNKFYDSMEDEVDEKVPYIKAQEINEKVDKWLGSNYKKEKPLFLWTHYMDVHEPYVPNKKYIDIVDPSLDISEDEMFSLFKNVLLKRDVSDSGKVELLKKLYLAHVREIDEAVKNFFEILEKNGILEDAVVILTTDHGEEFNEHGGLSHDGKFFQELIHIPMVIYDSSLSSGKKCDCLASTLDISPTIVSLFGLEPVEAFQGISILPLEKYKRKGIFGEAVDKHGSHETGQEKDVYYYLEGNLKIIYTETDDSWLLYDLEKDPKELNNIIKTSPYAEEMKKKLKPMIKRYIIK